MRRQFQVLRYRSKLDPSFSDLDLPFAIKLYYSMSTISYTPWFPYQFKMTLIACSRILKDRSLVEATRVGPPWQHARFVSTSGSPYCRSPSLLVSFRLNLKLYMIPKWPLDWHSHAPGPGEETGIDSLSVPGAGAVCSVRSTRRITVSVSAS